MPELLNIKLSASLDAVKCLLNLSESLERKICEAKGYLCDIPGKTFLYKSLHNISF